MFVVFRSIQIRVPNDKVGLVIGKGGETIKTLQTATRCSIQVHKEDPLNPQPDRTITLQGTEAAIARAETEIRRVVAPMGGGVSGGGRRPGLGSEGSSYGAAASLYGGVGGDNFIMKIRPDQVGLLIGRSGETIRMLQNRCGVSIQVQRDAETPGQTDRNVTIVGQPQAIELAKQEIDRVIADRVSAKHAKFLAILNITCINISCCSVLISLSFRDHQVHSEEVVMEDQEIHMVVTTAIRIVIAQCFVFCRQHLTILF